MRKMGMVIGGIIGRKIGGGLRMGNEGMVKGGK